MFVRRTLFQLSCAICMWFFFSTVCFHLLIEMCAWCVVLASRDNVNLLCLRVFISSSFQSLSLALSIWTLNLQNCFYVYRWLLMSYIWRTRPYIGQRINSRCVQCSRSQPNGTSTILRVRSFAYLIHWYLLRMDIYAVFFIYIYFYFG